MQQKKHDEKSDTAQPLQFNFGNARNDHDFVKEIIDAIPGLFYLLDANAQFVMWNNYVRDSVVFKSEKEMKAASALDSIHPDDRLLVRESIRNIISHGVDDSLDVRVFLRGGSEFLWYQLRGKRVFIDHKPFFIGLGTDITESKRSENHLQKMNRTLLALSKCNESILHAHTEEELLETICHIIVEIAGYRMVWVGYAEQDKAKSVTPVACAGIDEGYLANLNVSWADVERGHGPAGTAIRTGKPSLTRDVLNDPQFELWRMDALKRGYVAVQGFPLKAGNKVFGAVTVYSVVADAFDVIDTELLTTLADNLAYGISVLRDSDMHRLLQENMHQSEKRYWDLFQNHHTVMLIIDWKDGRIIDANPAAATFYGWPIETLCRMHIQDINTLSPDKVIAALQQAGSTEKNHFFFRHRRANSSVRDVEVFSNKIQIADKDFLYSIIHDVTERKKYEIFNAFHLSLILMEAGHSIEELLQTTIDEAELLTDSSIGFIHVVGEDQTTLTRLVWSSNTSKQRCNTIIGEGVHHNLDDAGLWADAAREQKAVIHNDYAAVNHRKGVPEGHEDVRREAVVPILRNDKVVAIFGVGNKLCNYDESDVKWLGLLADIAWNIVAKKMAEDEQKILQAQKYAMENIAMHDYMTGLPNRRLLFDRMGQALALGQRNKTMAALIIFDLDKFKFVNDTYGHAIGDSLLQEVAIRMLRTLQRSEDSIARLGGDEFVVLLPQIASIDHAVSMAKKIKQAMHEVFCVEGHAINISCSIGISAYPDHGQDELTLMKHADDAMYQSKDEGGNCITVYG